MKDFWSGFEKQAAEKRATPIGRVVRRSSKGTLLNTLYPVAIGAMGGMAAGRYLMGSGKKDEKKDEKKGSFK